MLHEGHARDEWDRTSVMLAMLYNCHRSHRTPAAKPAQFNPFCKQNVPLTAANIGLLKRFVPNAEDN